MADPGSDCPFPAIALRMYRIQLTTKLQDAEALGVDTTGLLAEICFIDKLRYAHELSGCPCWWAVVDRATAALLEEL